MRPPRKLSTEEELYAAALRALTRRAHSVYEMRQALERRADDEALVQRVLQRLKDAKLLDDARYARQFARYRAESRRQGRFRIARDLRARGVPDRHIEAALEDILRETDERALVRKRLERRLRQLDSSGVQAHEGGSREALDERKLASVYRSLLRAGFSADVIRAELRALTKQDVVELPDKVRPEDGR